MTSDQLNRLPTPPTCRGTNKNIRPIYDKPASIAFCGSVGNGCKSKRNH